MKSTCRNFFSCWTFIVVVLGFLTIFAHPSEAGRADGFAAPAQMLLKSSLATCYGCNGGWQENNDRQLVDGDDAFYVWTSQRRRGLEATGEDKHTSPSNKFHINLKELSSLNCQDGCSAAFALITSAHCNSSVDAALKFKLEEEIIFDMTDIESDEDASDHGWVTQSFRELTDNNTTESAPQISLADFVTAAAMVGEFIDAMTPNQDFYLAVYLYNNETEPLACATLDLVTEEEEMQVYYDLFGGGDEGEGSVVGEVEGAVAAVGNGSSPLSGGMMAYALAGVSVVFLSAILFA